MGTHKIAAIATPLVALALAFPTISNETIVGASDECEFTGELALTEEWRYAPTETSPSDHLYRVAVVGRPAPRGRSLCG